MKNEDPPYEYLELLVTLRCNLRCRNCIRLCNSEDVTGMDYAGLDMTMDQVRKVIEDVKNAERGTRSAEQPATCNLQPATPVVGCLVITGGEPTLHPQIVEIVALCERELVATGLAGRLVVNSNQLRPPPAAIARFVETYTRPEEKATAHCAVLKAPERPAKFAGCGHYRKWRVEASVHGYSLCCAAGGYMRLFGLRHLFQDTLPARPQDFGTIARMDEVCRHCAFGDRPVPESEAGRPVDEVYRRAAEVTKAGGNPLFGKAEG